MKVVIIDYGMGNVYSVKGALEVVGVEAVLTNDPESIKDASHIIIPGVGNFLEGMAKLRERQLDKAIKHAAVEKKIPVLGICLGMQLLAAHGLEGGSTSGLGLIPGKVIKLKSYTNNERIPHVGWNEVHFIQSTFITDGIVSGTDFYFVHSYHFLAEDKEYMFSQTPYCTNFTSIVCNENIIGVQFHPEKSSRAGLKLLENFIKC